MTAPSGASYSERNADYWRRNLVVCVFGSFSTLVSLSMLLPFLPLFVQQLGVDSQSAVVEWSGIAFSATFFGTAITAPLWGRLADRYGRKPMLTRAAVGMAIVMSLIGLAQNVTELVGLRLLAGLIGGYASASTVMIGTQTPPDRAGWALGILSTGALAGNLIGPLIGGLLPPLIGIRGTFFFGGGIIAVAALLTIFVVREDFQPASDARTRVTRAFAAPTNYPVKGSTCVPGVARKNDGAVFSHRDALTGGWTAQAATSEFWAFFGNSPVRYCASPKPNDQSPIVFSTMDTMTSFGSIPHLAFRPSHRSR